MREIVNVRHYEDRTIPEKIKANLFTAFSYSYSSGNAQPWEVIIINKGDELKQVIKATLAPDLNDASFGGQLWIKDAPLVCLVMMDKRRALARIGKRGYAFSLHDTAFAIQNFRLMAEVQHLKTACVREFDVDKMAKN